MQGQQSQGPAEPGAEEDALGGGEKARGGGRLDSVLLCTPASVLSLKSLSEPMKECLHRRADFVIQAKRGLARILVQGEISF